MSTKYRWDALEVKLSFTKDFMKVSTHQQIDLIVKSFDYIANKMIRDSSGESSLANVHKVLVQDIERYKAAMRVLLRDEGVRLEMEHKNRNINKQEFLAAYRESKTTVECGLTMLDNVLFRFTPQAKAA